MTTIITGIYIGEAVGLGNNVYNMSMFHAIDALSDDKLIRFPLHLTADINGQQPLVALLEPTAKGKVILLDTRYSPAGQ